MSVPYYLKVSRASDLKDKKERKIFRALEMLPGAFSWLTLILIFVLSWLKPFWVSVFIIFFVVYCLLRVVYFSFHLHACYRQMKKNEKIDWLEKLNKLPGGNWQHIWHLVILPMYQEPLGVVRPCFQALAKTDWPKDKMIVVLTCEETGGNEARQVAENIGKEFGDTFFKLLVTFHPRGLAGEIAGKGSNDSWGSKEAKEKLIDPLNIPYENIIVSSFDVDTCVFPKYFSCLAYRYLTVESPLRTSFQPVALYVNNIWQAPFISRIFSFSVTFWEMMCQERPEKLLTFSSHSMSFKALVDVGFRQTNIVSDDSRIFWQCFLKYDGDYKVVSLYYPLSMDANVAPSFFQTMKNVYRQQRRWAYGMEDIPYFLFAFLKNKKIALRKKLYWFFILFEMHWSWATTSFIVLLLGWLPIILGGEGFRQSLLSYNLPTFTRNILIIGMIGLVASAYFSILLLPPRPPIYGKTKYLFFALEWILLPIIMIFFTALPSLDAQTRWLTGKYMGFWHTTKIRK